MLNGGFENLPPNAWKPFGNGQRSCIGRPFAWQESLLAMVLVLKHLISNLLIRRIIFVLNKHYQSNLKVLKYEFDHVNKSAFHLKQISNNLKEK